MAVEGGVVKYRKNGSLLYTSAAAPTYPLLVDSSLYVNGSPLTNVMLSGAVAGQQNVSWTSSVGVSVSANNLTKTASNGWGNAGAASTQTIVSGDGYVEFSAGTTGDSMIGLGNGDPDQNYDIDFAVHVDSGAASIWESGVWKAAAGTYVSGDVFRVAVEGGVVKYRKNGALLYTSAATPTYPLLVDSSLYTNGATLNAAIVSGNLSGGSSSAQINWLVTDHLGTPRMVIDQTGTLAGVKRHDYLPFGEELLAGTGGRTLPQGYSGDAVRQKFTAKERDIETGLDYFGARFYSSTQGRFTSVDPSRRSIIGANPQTWNRYTYTYNNPLALVDDNGKWPKGTHDRLIEKAFPGLTRREIRQIQRGSHSVDVKRGVPITLIESQAPKHAQTPGSYVREMGSVPAAQARAMGESATFVATKTAEATQHQLAGNSSKALFAIGEASHPVTDNTSPAHAGFQVYSVPQTVVMVPGIGLPAVVPDAAQLAKELREHEAREARPPTPEEEKAAIDGLRAVYASALGQEALQRAITEPPPPPQPMPRPTPERR
ncbi:MAG TPA: RHS repeat-associated core domain-containing protein [Pyrinomonadaceae bacterium]